MKTLITLILSVTAFLILIGQFEAGIAGLFFAAFCYFAIGELTLFKKKYATKVSEPDPHSVMFNASEVKSED